MVTSERIRWVGLPKIDINTLTNATSGFVPFAQADIDNETKRNCSATFSDGYGSQFFPGGPLVTNVALKGRGNFTWTRAKKPYNIDILGAANFSKRNVSMFGMPADSDWSILADYDDFTHCRTLLASAWSYAFGQWGSRGLKAELYFNGTYYGLVTFCERVKRAAHRIAITKLNPTDLTEPNITGGYVFEGQDISYIVAGEKYFTDARFGEVITYKIPGADEVVAAQNTWSEALFNDFLTRLYTQPLDDLTNGYRAVADPVTLAQYLLIQDTLHNPDGNSFYLTKDRNEKLKGGPFWDAGVTLGAIETAWGPNPSNPRFDGMQVSTVPWWGKLLEDAHFREVLAAQFAAALPKLHRAYADLRAFLTKLNGPETMTAGATAIERDWAAWAHSDTLFAGDFPRNVPRMLDFIEQRLYWMTRAKFQPVEATA